MSDTEAEPIVEEPIVAEERETVVAEEEPVADEEPVAEEEPITITIEEGEPVAEEEPITITIEEGEPVLAAQVPVPTQNQIFTNTVAPVSIWSSIYPVSARRRRGSQMPFKW